jgi:hypothetical protein
VAAGPDPKSKASEQSRGRKKRSRSEMRGPLHAQTHVRCRICHRWYQAITYTHLRYRHGILDPKTYKEQFSLSKITSADVRRRIAERKILVDRHATDYIRKNWGRLSLKEITGYLGINPSTVRTHAMRLGLTLLVEKWTDAKVIRLLREARKLGRPLSSGEVRHQMGSLYKAAIKRFGSWKLALVRAGIAYEKVARRGPFETWTRDRIFSEIRSLALEGKERDYAHLPSYHSKLYAAARNHFDNWTSAVRAAGISDGS